MMASSRHQALIKSISSAYSTKSVPIKCVCIGDSAVGKTALLTTYISGIMPSEHMPTILENFEVTIEENDHEIILETWDTSGSQSYGEIRSLVYNNADVFIVCYAIDSPSSLENVRKQWIPEIRSHSRQIPFVLVGTKSDLRPHKSEKKELSRAKQSLRSVDPVKASDEARTLGAYASTECSSLEKTGVKAVFSKAIEAALDISVAKRGRKRKPKKNSCTLL